MPHVSFFCNKNANLTRHIAQTVGIVSVIVHIIIVTFRQSYDGFNLSTVL